MPDPASATEAVERLQDFIQRHEPGSCKWLSLGADRCPCPRCDLDRVREQAHASGVAEGREQAAKHFNRYLRCPGLGKQHYLQHLPGCDSWNGGQCSCGFTPDAESLARALGPQAAGTGREGA